MRGRPRMEQVRVGHARTGVASRLVRRPARCRVMLMTVVSAAVAGCSSGGHVRISDSAQATSPSATASSSSPTPSAPDQVLSQYRAFWAHLTPASLAAAGQRRAILAPFAEDPELTSLIRGMAQQDRRGEAIYGENVPHPTIGRLSVAQGLAVVRDCQDSSRSGVERRSTHARLTVGVKANPVVATLHLGADGTWRVSFVSYPKTTC